MSNEILREPLSPRFTDALTLACDLHRGQPRKGTQIPYVAHLLAVASLALDHGASEDEAIAAVLHDAVEDQGGAVTAARIREQFGAAVADIVIACSDTDVVPKPPWRARKETYIAHVRSAPASVRLVSASDKLHNARAILADYRNIGEHLWDRLAGGREGTLWYYRSLVEAFASHGKSRLVEELDRVVTEIESLTAAARAAIAARARARTTKRFEVYGIDTFEATSGDGGSGKYDLAWFDTAEEVLAFARKKAAKPHHGDADLCDSVHVYDHDEERSVTSARRPSTGGSDV